MSNIDRARIVLGFWLAATLVVSVAAQATNVTGKWIFDVQTDAGSGTPTVVFKQEGEKLTGHYTGQLGDTDFAGTVKGNEITFSFKGETQGTNFTVTYTGIVEKDTIKGSVDIGGLASGTFTGKRQ
ncbi:MAG TPA: hypothetical protein VEK56_06605 [Vicinamibacterales bacterium]|nr:hypothetical protein [Vicinamibacterales bacterium]